MVETNTTANLQIQKQEIEMICRLIVPMQRNTKLRHHVRKDIVTKMKAFVSKFHCNREVVAGIKKSLNFLNKTDNMSKQQQSDIANEIISYINTIRCRFNLTIVEDNKKTNDNECLFIFETFSEIIDKLKLDVNNRSIYNDESMLKLLNMVDKNTSQYKVSDKEPMINIMRENETYHLRYCGVDKIDNNLEKLCQILRDKIIEVNKYNERNIPIINVDKHALILYDKLPFIMHNITKTPYFDINQILSVLKIIKSTTIRNKYKDNIKAVNFWKNQYNGYNYRELIDVDGLCRIVANSKWLMKDNFEKDIRGIIETLYNVSLTNVTVDLVYPKNIKTPVGETKVDEIKVETVPEITTVAKRAKPKRYNTVEKVLTFDEIVEKYKIDKDNKTKVNLNTLTDLKRICDKSSLRYQCDDDHPMIGIGIGDKAKYRLQYKNHCGQNDDLPEITNMLKKIIADEYTNKVVVMENISTVGFFAYGDHIFIYYGNPDKALFDIHQILPLLKIQKASQVYNKYVNDITAIFFDKNEFGGYNVRELVPLNVVSQIIINSKVAFKDSFVKDISMILEHQQEKGLMLITNDHFMINPNANPNPNAQLNVNTIVPAPITIDPNYTHPITKKVYHQTYANKELVTLLDKRIESMQSKEVFIKTFDKKHLLYFLRIQIPNEPRIIVKLGYSYHISDRLQSIKNKWKCSVNLIGLKEIDAEAIELAIHDSLKKLYPDMCYADKSGIVYNEYYVFDNIITKFFDDAPEYNEIKQMSTIDNIIALVHNMLPNIKNPDDYSKIIGLLSKGIDLKLKELDVANK